MHGHITFGSCLCQAGSAAASSSGDTSSSTGTIVSLACLFSRFILATLNPFFACIQDAWPYHLWSMSLPGRSSNTCCSFIIHTHYCELGKFLFQVDSGKSQPVFACTQDRGLGIELWVVAFFLHKQLNCLWQGLNGEPEAEPADEADWFLWIIPAPLGGNDNSDIFHSYPKFPGEQKEKAKKVIWPWRKEET